MCSGECKYLVYFFFSTKFNIGFASFFFSANGKCRWCTFIHCQSLPIFLFSFHLIPCHSYSSLLNFFFLLLPSYRKYYLRFFICIGMRKKKFGFVNVKEVVIKIRICFFFPLRHFEGECEIYHFIRTLLCKKGFKLYSRVGIGARWCGQLNNTHHHNLYLKFHSQFLI